MSHLRSFRCERGQTIIMVTFSLVALMGMLGLVVDLGWSHFIKKSAQSAADAAAMAAAQKAFEQVGGVTMAICGVNVTCQSLQPCPSTIIKPPGDNIQLGCLYAQSNGFTQGERQGITVQADTTTPAPTVPGVFVDYWVTVRTTQSIPQLFSAVLGNPNGMVASRATAAIVDSPNNGTVFLLDRENDPSPFGTGNDLSAQGGGALNSTGAIYMASISDGGDLKSSWAGHTGGSSTITSSVTQIRGDGWVDYPSNWVPAPQNHQVDDFRFSDPMKNKGQPAAPPPQAAGGPPLIAVPGGDMPTTVTPGRYYAVNNRGLPTGQPLQFGGSSYTFNNNGRGFGDYVFFGGAAFSNPGTVATFAPGRYFFAGSQANRAVFSMNNGVTLRDNTPLAQGGNNTDAGEIFIFTDTNYPGLEVPAFIRELDLGYGAVSLQMGNTEQSLINLHGLNGTSADLPAALKPFAPVVFWQDQGNSPILYTANGNIDITSCGPGHSLSNPCPNLNPKVNAEMNLQAYPSFHLYGVFYQPRGGSLNFQAHGTISNPLMIVTGSMMVQGSPLYLQPLTRPLMVRHVALIE